MSISFDGWEIIGIVCGLVLFIVGLRLAAKPKLLPLGGGSGMINVPNRDVMATSISFENVPKFMGLTVNRGAAQIEYTRLYDPALKEYVGPILMWSVGHAQDLSAKCTIEAGKQGILYPFAKDRYSKEYFVPNGKSLNSDLDRAPITWSDYNKKFTICLIDVLGNEHKYDVNVRNSDQSVGIGFKFTFRNRVELLIEGFRAIFKAFSIRRW